MGEFTEPIAEMRPKNYQQGTKYFALLDSIFLRGGNHYCQTIEERDKIPLDLRKPMVQYFYVENEQQMFRLEGGVNNENFKPYNVQGSTIEFANPILPNTLLSITPDNKIRSESNLFVFEYYFENNQHHSIELDLPTVANASWLISIDINCITRSYAENVCAGNLKSAFGYFAWGEIVKVGEDQKLKFTNLPEIDYWMDISNNKPRINFKNESIEPYLSFYSWTLRVEAFRNPGNDFQTQK